MHRGSGTSIEYDAATMIHSELTHSDMTQSGHQHAPIEDLTVCYTTFNSMRTLPQSLDAAGQLAARIVVVDSGSTDGTIELCQSHGIEPTHRDWTTPVEQKTFAMSLCGNSPWTLLLDSDETVLDELAANIRQTLAMATEHNTGFKVNRVVWLDGRALQHTYQPEWRLRLVRNAAAVIKGDNAGGHDRIEVTSGNVGKIHGALKHDSWANVSDMLARGAFLGARTGRAARRGGGILNLAFNPGWSFFKQLILKKAFLDGWRGWAAAGGVAAHTLCKHVTIMERRGLEREQSRNDSNAPD